MHHVAARTVDAEYFFKEPRASFGGVPLKQPGDRRTDTEPSFARRPEQCLQRNDRVDRRVRSSCAQSPRARNGRWPTGRWRGSSLKGVGPLPSSTPAQRRCYLKRL